jgi:hypothetical protein
MLADQTCCGDRGGIFVICLGSDLTTGLKFGIEEQLQTLAQAGSGAGSQTLSKIAKNGVLLIELRDEKKFGDSD